MQIVEVILIIIDADSMQIKIIGSHKYFRKLKVGEGSFRLNRTIFGCEK